MTPIELEKLSIYNAGIKVYCHPNNYYWLKKHLRSVEHPINIPKYVHRQQLCEIYTNKNLEEFQQRGWEITEPYRSDPLISWVDDIENPPSWCIYFKIVKPKLTRMVYVITQRMSYGFPRIFNPNIAS